MRKLFIALAIGALLSAGQLANAGQLEDARAAYNRGDYASAYRLWRLLAGQGNADARNNIGMMYEYGFGIDQDFSQAVDWYRLAALQGNSGAQNNLGTMYEIGRGVSIDYDEALKWYRLAAQQGNAKAQNNLAAMYANGRGVAPDFVRAYMWLNIAGQSLDVADRIKTEQVRGQVQKKMTAAQIVQAQALARECADSKYRDCETEVLAAKEPAPAPNASRSIMPDISRSIPTHDGSISIQMKRTTSETYVVPVLINDTIMLDFVIDSGATDVVIPGDVVSTLMRAGALKQTDFFDPQIATLAGGSKIPLMIFRIRSLNVGDNIVENVMGSTSLQPRGHLLLGQSFLNRFKSWSIDNSTHVLRLYK